VARRRGARGKGFDADKGTGKPPAVPNPEPGGITARLLALGWRWDSRGVLVQLEGFEGCRLSEDNDFIGSRYKVATKGVAIYRSRASSGSRKEPGEEMEGTAGDGY
jgi:hypothetical protein